MYRTVFFVAAAGVLAVLLVHWLLIAGRRARSGSTGELIHRYGLVERLVHAGSLVAFLVAAATGFWPVLVHGAGPAGWTKLVHTGAGGLLGLLVAAMGLLWALDATFAHLDWPWIKALGGHVSRTGPPPAGRFDAGQKVFFWATLGLALATLLSGVLRVSYGLPLEVQRYALVIHQYTALAFGLCIVVHGYVMMIAKPGALGAMITGSVRRAWAERYHSLWYTRNK